MLVVADTASSTEGGVSAQEVAGTTSVPETSGLPLQPSRFVRFRVTEGTWMCLDVAPDGRAIVFDLLDDLYTLPINGGKATRITSGVALNRQPRYSPDGRYLAFVSDRGGSENVWIADRDGRHARQLSDLHGYDGDGAVTSPAWAPDGRTIVVSQRLGATRPGGNPDPIKSRAWLLGAYNVETGQMQWISDTAPGRARSTLGAAFGPEDRTVYAAIDDFSKEPWTEVRNWRVVRINTVTGRIQPEMGGNVGRVGMRPVLSRNGRYLVYATSSGSHVGLRLRDLGKDRERWLVRELLDDPPFAGGEARDLVPGYAFTPDSKALIAAYGGKIHRIDLATGRTAEIPFLAEVKRGLGPLKVYQFALPDTAVRTRSVLQPALSPDGHSVTFSALDRIWVMELPHDGHPSGQPYRATADSGLGEFYPSWSPDGHWIVYSAWMDGEGGAVRRVRVMDDPLARPFRSERLTSDTALYFHTAVAPDGERVVAVRATIPPERLLTDYAFRALADSSPYFDLTLVGVPMSSGVPRVIASLAAVYSPWFRYPVDQVYFTEDCNRVYVGLTSWRWDGTDQRAALAVLGRESSGELVNDPFDITGVLSLNGRRALIVRKYALFELSLPSVRVGQTATVDLDQIQTEPLGARVGAARRWGTALAPEISWSRDGRRVLFTQGGTLFVGDIRPDRWTTFARVDVPLMVPVDVPHGTLVLHAARLITMRGHEVIERGDVIVRNNRILAVGAVGQVAIPKGAQVLNVSGATILPGYVDVHDHLVMPKGVHAGQEWRCLVRLAYGVTAVRDPEANLSNDIFAYRERERTGGLLCPRVFSTGIPYYGADPPISTLEEANDAVRPDAEYFGSETFKVYYDYSTDRRARQLLALAVSGQGLNATAHTNGIELAMASIVDGLSGIEHAPDIRIYDDIACLIARSGATQTHTYLATLAGSRNYMVRHYGSPMKWATMRRFVPPSERAAACYHCAGEEIPAHGPLEFDNLLPLVRGASRIVVHGGRVAMGAHGTVPGLGFHYEMWLHALGGMARHEILRSATIVGATAIGHARDLGSLEEGKLADLQVLDRNPLVDIHNTTSIHYIMKNGRLYAAENLTEFWPRHEILDSIHVWGPNVSATMTKPQHQPTRRQVVPPRDKGLH
jgi:imidazolonepropionase-like amidohydrolase/Tol biopolymer transport system component